VKQELAKHQKQINSCLVGCGERAGVKHESPAKQVKTLKDVEQQASKPAAAKGELVQIANECRTTIIIGR
jgi:hypothetical protein